LYRWASTQNDLILIAGHTHRPVWSSLTHLDKLLNELYYLQSHRRGHKPKVLAQRLRDLAAEIKVREQKYPPCNDTLKTRYCYFNTGCCVFEDGDITGIEIDGGRDGSPGEESRPAEMRLVKWGRDSEAGTKLRAGIVRDELESQSLEEIFLRLRRD
jgi:hypothetical protein